MIGASFTRPANTTAYVVGQIIANSVTAGSVVPLTFLTGQHSGRNGFIRRVRIKTNDTAWLNATIRLHLYELLPTFANGDGANWAAGTTESNYLGYSDVTLDRSFSDYVKGNGVPAVGSEFNFTVQPGGSLYGVLEARTAVTPGSATSFTAVLEGIND